MNETEIKFERENISGLAVEGTYLIDAARRIGIEVEAECGRLGLCDTCAMTITSGSDSLSAPTKAEIEKFSITELSSGVRLSCQAKIEKGGGELVIMTKEKKKEPTPEEKSEDFRKEFEEMPLEKKIASLVRLEVIALGETINFVLNSPFKIIEKGMDVLAEFGLKMDAEAKKASRPEEHQTDASEETNGKKASKKKSAKKAAKAEKEEDK